MATRRLLVGLFLVSLLLSAVGGCAGPESAGSSQALISQAKEFRALLGEKRYDDARARMAPQPRRWFEVVEGEGMAWNVGPEGGPWSGWDAHFRSESEVLRWTADLEQRSATVLVREINDYYRMLDRGWSLVEVTYFFDDAQRIRGMLIHGLGPREYGRTDEFLAWAREHDPDELAYLRPDDRIDPTGDRPARHRALINRWRVSVGLDEITVD